MTLALTTRSKKALALFLALSVLAGAGLTYRYLRPPAIDAFAILPPGAGLLAGADLAHLRRTLLWWSLTEFFFRSELPRDEAYDRFLAQTGFQFERDIDHITLALTPARPRSAFVAVVSGRFPREALVRYALGHGAVRTERAGVAIYHAPLGPDRQLWFAPLSEKVFLVGNGATLEAAVDRARSRLRFPNDDTPLLAVARAQAAAGEDIWVVADPKLWPDPSPVPRALAQAVDLAWFVGKLNTFGIDLKLEATCRSELEASLAESNLSGFRFALRAAVARQRPRDAQLEKLVQEIVIHREGTRVRVSARVGLDTLAGWFAATERKELAPAR